MLSFSPRGVLDEILNLIESVSEGFPSYFYPSELQLNKANVSDTEASFFIYIYLYQMVLLRLKFIKKEMILILIL